MDINILRKRFEIWKHILLITLGASLSLFMQALLKYLESQSLIQDASWYGVWFVVMLASFLPGLVLLWGKHWMQIPLADRLNTVFGYFALAWFTFLPVGIRVGRYESKSFNFVLLGCAIAISIGYWWLRRKSIDSQEIFP